MTFSRFILALLMTPAMAMAGPDLAPYFNFDGVLTDPSGNPITANVPITFRITDPGGTCLLYEEQQMVTPGVDGSISLRVGSQVGDAKRSGTNDPGRNWADVFQNTMPSPVASGTCNSGWTPMAGDGRSLQVIVNGTPLAPNYALAAVPTATVAETLNGKRETDFLQPNMASGHVLNQANLENLFVGSNYTNLQNVLTGNVMPASPTTPVNFNGQALNNIAPPILAGDAANKNYVDSSLGGKALDTNITAGSMASGDTLRWDGVLNRWTSGPATMAGGSFGNIQFNDGGGQFMGISALQWDNVSFRLSIVNPTPNATLDVMASSPSFPVASFKGLPGQLAPLLMVVDDADNAKFMVTPSGNVGLGTTAPSAPLHVASASTGAIIVETNPGGSNGPFVQLKDSRSSGRMWNLASGMNGLGQLNFYDATMGVTRLTISTSGNVGIGTTNPLAKLQVSGTIAGGEKIIATGAAIDLSLGNTQILQSPGTGALTLSNLAPGGRYRIIIEDTTPQTYTFSGCMNSYFSPTNGATSGRTIYDLTYTSSGSCYIAWATGYN